MERKVGTIYGNDPRGWFFVCTCPQDRFFLHLSEYHGDHLPYIGEKVSFDVAPPRKLGQLSCAVNVTPIVPAQGKEVL